MQMTVLRDEGDRGERCPLNACRRKVHEAGERVRTAALAPANKSESVLPSLHRTMACCDSMSRATYHSGRLDLYHTKAAGAAAAARLAAAAVPWYATRMNSIWGSDVAVPSCGRLEEMGSRCDAPDEYSRRATRVGVVARARELATANLRVEMV